MIDKSFYVNLKGRDFVLFGGLLDAATKAGLKSVITEIKQIPDAANGHIAVVTSRVEFDDGRVFQEVGDASPASVGSMIVPHLLRMASTRSTGRAFRLALNVSATMKEELGGDDEPETIHGSRPAANGKPAAVSAPRAAVRPLAAAPAPPIFLCAFPKCGEGITTEQSLASEAAYGVQLCEKHSYLQPQKATTTRGTQIVCQLDGCGAELTNNEVLLSHNECKMRLCERHRIEMMEGKESNPVPV